MWFWLAMIISGSNQQDKMRRGEESESVPMLELRHIQPDVHGIFIHNKLKIAIRRLFSVARCHTQLRCESQVAGISMRVGTRIFSIGGGLGFVDDQFRGFEQLLLGGLDLHWPRRLKRLIVI